VLDLAGQLVGLESAENGVDLFVVGRVQGEENGLRQFVRLIQFV
jgi:hypothetical protein